MPRGAVYDILDADSTLRALLGGAGRIKGQGALDGMPAEGYILILSWDPPRVIFRDNGETYSSRKIHRLSVYVHRLRHESTDYNAIQKILNRIEITLCSSVHFVGVDGSSIAQARFIGGSSDLMDPTFDTITKNISFEITGKEAA